MSKDTCVICYEAISHPDFGGMDRDLCPRVFPATKCAYPLHFKCKAALLLNAGERDLPCVVCREVCDKDEASFDAAVGLSRESYRRSINGDRRNRSQRRQRAAKKASNLAARTNGTDRPEMDGRPR